MSLAQLKRRIYTYTESLRNYPRDLEKKLSAETV